MVAENSWEWFQKQVALKSGIDLEFYKRPQMERRINSFMRSVGAANYVEFIKLLNDSHETYRKFIDHLTINVSEFFRNKSHWDVLQKTVIPELLKERVNLKIWSAGCSTGEEPYSLAMLMKEYFPGKFDKIMATDLDNEVLAKAQAGRYFPKSTQGMDQALVRKYFTEQDGMLLIKDEIKNLVRFQKQDLLKDTFPNDIDLILCRNVVIYFTEEAKDKLYKKFVGALRKNGVLFIGSTEQIFQARELGLRSMATFFYQKTNP